MLFADNLPSTNKMLNKFSHIETRNRKIHSPHFTSTRELPPFYITNADLIKMPGTPSGSSDELFNSIVRIKWIYLLNQFFGRSH
jgi:hypothetical protein